MSKNQEQIWYKLITSLQKEGVIQNGLTIPYILGAIKIVDNKFKITDTSVLNLFKQIVNSDLELKSVLQHCDIGQYVIGLQSKSNCETKFPKELAFTNEKGEKSLYVTSNANPLGDNIEKISENLLYKYKECIEKEHFSWNVLKRKWEEFSPVETMQIKLIFDESQTKN